MYCFQLLNCRAVTSQEQVAALAGIITYVTFQIEYCIQKVSYVHCISFRFFFNIITDFMKNSAFSFCGSYYFMAALA